MESKSIKDTGHPKEATTMNHRSYYVAHTHSADGPPSKRRRHREELEFAAATVASALADAGRPSSLTSVTAGRRRERALPPGSVDLALARVVTSREFDEELESEAAEDASDGNGAVETVEREEDGGQPRQPVAAMQQQGECATKSDNKDSSQSDGNNSSSNERDVSSMYMLSGLIQSTRHYYGFAPTYEGDLQSFSTKCEMNSRRHANGKQLEENSEGHSSWTPSSSCGDLVDEDYHSYFEGKRRKELDNDNRSDEQSGSDMGDSLSCTSSDSPLPNDDSKKWWGCGGGDRRESLSSIEGPLLIVG